MKMYYVGDNNKFGFEYGKKYDVVPAEKNEPKSDCMGIVVKDCETHKVLANYLLTFEDLADSFTCNKFQVNKLDIPKRPYLDNGYMVCPNCMEVVKNKAEYCDNCYQDLKWD